MLTDAELQEMRKNHRIQEGMTWCYNDSAIDINKLLDEIERLKAERKWISVEDRLPESDILFLVCEKSRVWPLIAAHYDTGFWYDKDSQELAAITHWMPLGASVPK